MYVRQNNRRQTLMNELLSPKMIRRWYQIFHFECRWVWQIEGAPHIFEDESAVPLIADGTACFNMERTFKEITFKRCSQFIVA
jgi:hypothetical protein